MVHAGIVGSGLYDFNRVMKVTAGLALTPLLA